MARTFLRLLSYWCEFFKLTLRIYFFFLLNAFWTWYLFNPQESPHSLSNLSNGFHGDRKFTKSLSREVSTIYRSIRWKMFSYFSWLLRASSRTASLAYFLIRMRLRWLDLWRLKGLSQLARPKKWDIFMIFF